jgi:hypothetical protein
MQFEGFEVTSVGNATLSLSDNKLLVSDIGESGLDGVLINTEGHPKFKVHFSEFNITPENNGIVKYTTLMKSGFNQIYPVNEQFEWYEPEINKIVMGYNSRLLPETFHLVGYLDGNEVFDFEEEGDNPTPAEESMFLAPLAVIAVASLVVGVASLAIAVYDQLKPTQRPVKIYVKDANGNVVNVSCTYIKDPDPFEITVHNQTFIVNEVGIKKDVIIDPPLEPTDQERYLPKNAGYMVTAARIGQFSITSIEDLMP